MLVFFASWCPHCNNGVVGVHSGEAPREAYEGWIEKALGGR